MNLRTRPLVEVVSQQAGPGDFFAAVRALFHNRARRYFSWQEWDEFFKLADEHGMFDVIPAASGRVQDDRDRYPLFTRALWRLRKAVLAAQAGGTSAQDFHEHERAQAEALERQRKYREEIEQRDFIARRKANAERQFEARRRPKVTTSDEEFVA